MKEFFHEAFDAKFEKAFQKAFSENFAVLMEYFDAKMLEMKEYVDETVEKKVSEKAEETKRHFDVVAEDMRHDMQGIYKDRTEQNDDKLKDHERRITRVERHVGIAV